MDPWSIPLPPERRQIDREGKERRGGQCGRGWRPNLPPEDAVRTTDGYERAAPRRAHGGRDSQGFPACADARARAVTLGLVVSLSLHTHTSFFVR